MNMHEVRSCYRYKEKGRLLTWRHCGFGNTRCPVVYALETQQCLLLHQRTRLACRRVLTAPCCTTALLDKTRELLSTELAALVGESYERAYADMVRVQQVRELEEVIDRQLAVLRNDPDAEARWQLTREMWRGRLKGLQNNVEVWQALLSVRSLVVPMSDDHWTWLKFAALCRKTKRPRLAERVYRQLLQYDPLTVPKGQRGFGAGSGAPTVMYGYLKHLWMTESSHSLARKTEAYTRMVDLSAEVPVELSGLVGSALVKPPTPGLVNGTMARTASALPAGGTSLGVGGRDRYEPPLSAKVHLKLCEWLWYLAKQEAVRTAGAVCGVDGVVCRCDDCTSRHLRSGY